MVKRSFSFKKKTTFRRKRKATTKRSSKAARRQQDSSMTWIRKKYTKVFEIPIGANSDKWNVTVSLIGTKNSNDVPNTITLSDVNQDNQLSTDMRLYQFFRIRGVATKMFFPMPTDVASSPVQWVSAYSANEVMLPGLLPARAQTLATYQTGNCNQNRPVSRFYNTAKTYRRFGIQYCDTSQFGQFAAANITYGTSLPVNSGSSVNLKVFRQQPNDTVNVVGRLQVTYYVTYKGNKGTGSLIA